MKNRELKKRIIEISYKLGLGHIGSCLTAVDIIEEIYSIKTPDEKFVLSAGHAHLAHLVVMDKYRQGQIDIDPAFLLSRYGIHCDRKAGCDASTGSLGHGIGIAVGMALADRDKNVYVLLSDGELAEGSVYEAINVARRQQLNNLKVFVNNNRWAAYRNSDINEAFWYHPNMDIIATNMNDYPKWLKGQIAHYKVLNKEEYEELLKILE